MQVLESFRIIIQGKNAVIILHPIYLFENTNYSKVHTHICSIALLWNYVMG